MKKILFIAAFTTLFCIQCTTKKDRYAITNETIGPVTNETLIKELDSIFANDSLVRAGNTINALGTQGEVEVFTKEGIKLLRLTPDDDTNPEAVINTVRVYDSRYKTDKGLTINSTFKDLKDNYEIAGIQTSIDAVVIFLKNSNIYITINKNELPENIRYDASLTIEASQIPDTAKFKYFMIAWDSEN